MHIVVVSACVYMVSSWASASACGRKVEVRVGTRTTNNDTKSMSRLGQRFAQALNREELVHVQLFS